MKALKSLIDLAKHKNHIDMKRGEEKYMNPHWHLDAIKAEVEEVREELRPNNMVHLEDELCDILWGWMILVEKLKESDYVGSHEAIISRALKKYEERILALKGNAEDHLIWKEVKARQKVMLEVEKGKNNEN
ncbi:MAG: Unknown protein [uncultured Sulfurovum sp.]|uniref:NTP pyrophosphohydrolase MazG-like domain-containing protein n=1 Tax=uncultured Sulfurovum sp. TaxID=269237 RepID=A0A6S6S1R5_9BACT|nr:MAG: Unknown protein [uncultured Sulfurovum sp.]